MINRRNFLQSLAMGSAFLAAPFRYWEQADKTYTALVLETPEIKGLWSAVSGDNISRIGNQHGAATMLAQAGFEVAQLQTDQPFRDQPADLLFLGSYISTHDDLAEYLERNAKDIRKFVENGGVLVQMAEAPPYDHFYNSSQPKHRTSPFLFPSHLHAERTRETFWDLYVRLPDHPLLKNMQIEDNQTENGGLSGQFGHNASWMAMGNRRGFNVLLSNTEDDSRTALLEGVHGRGRYVLSSLFLDRLYDGEGNATRSPEFMETARTFYNNLFTYTRELHTPKGMPARLNGKYEDPAPAAVPEGGFSLALIPDTQYYCQNPEHHVHFQNLTRWLADHRESYNIQYAMHLGDVVNRGGNEMQQWEFASEAMSALDGEVPYSISLGNHDYTDDSSRSRDTPLNDYFHPSRFEKQPGFGGCMEEGHLENTFHHFEVQDQKYLILALEFGPRDHVLEWANDIVSQHRDHRAILATHAYMYSDSYRFNLAERSNWQAWNPHNYQSEGGNNDGKDMWDKLISRHPNFILVACGHVINDGLGRKSMVTPHGNTVHQMLCNYQGYYQGGMGTIRLLHFHPDGNRIQVRTYSTSRDQYFTGIQNQFQLDLTGPTRQG